MVPDTCKAQGNIDGKPFSISTTGKAAHGSTPEDGENAILILMSNLYENKKCRLSEFFRRFIGLEFNGKSLGGYCCDSASGEATYNIGRIETVNDLINLFVDVRYPVTVDINSIIKEINNNLYNNGFGEIKAELVSNKPSVYMDKEGSVIKELLSAYQEHTGDMSSPTVIGGGTYARAMDGIVAFGPMLPGRELTEHQANEYIFEKDLYLAKEIYKTAIKNLLKM